MCIHAILQYMVQATKGKFPTAHVPRDNIEPELVTRAPLLHDNLVLPPPPPPTPDDDDDDDVLFATRL